MYFRISIILIIALHSILVRHLIFARLYDVWWKIMTGCPYLNGRIQLLLVSVFQTDEQVFVQTIEKSQKQTAEMDILGNSVG